jgi:thymidylate kinase
MIKGKYIVFEGTEGVGKSALSKALAQKLGAFWTHEPYGGPDMPICSYLRNASVSQSKELTMPARELMLLAGRSMSLKHIVAPKLEAGQTVISDRSFISGMVYAKIEGMEFQRWVDLARLAKIDLIKPDYVILVSASEFRPKAGNEDRYDSRGDTFFLHIEQLFEEVLFKYSLGKIIRFKNDMSISIEENFKNLMLVLEDLFKEDGPI